MRSPLTRVFRGKGARVAEGVAFPVTLSAFCGAFHALLDVWATRARLASLDVIYSIVLAGLLYAVVQGLLAVSILFYHYRNPFRFFRRTAVALMLGAAVFGVVVCFRTFRGQPEWQAILTLLGAMGAGVVVSTVAMRSDRLGEPWYAVFFNVVVFQLFLCLCLVSASPLGVAGFWGVALAVTGAGLVWGIGRRRIAWPVVRVAPVVCIFVTTGILLVAGNAEPAVTRADHASKVGMTAAKPEAPNVVLIVLDTTRRDHLGAYGSSYGLTPHLDGLARESSVYASAFSNSSWTVPAHASMFTGLYPSSHGCTNEHHLWLDDGFTTLAEVLGGQGYETAACAANHFLFECNLLQGFDRVERLSGDYEALTTARAARLLGVPRKWVDKGGVEATETVSRWLEAGLGRDGPFFLFINLLEAHAPYAPPLAQRARFSPLGRGLLQASLLSESFDLLHTDARELENPPQAATARAQYRAEINYQDQVVGEILERLRSHIDLDRTLLIVTADHGEQLGENGRWGHSWGLHDTLIRVPLLIRYPKRFAPGTRIEGICETLDVFSTVTGVAGVDAMGTAGPGRSLVPDEFVAREAALTQIWPAHMHLGLLRKWIPFDRDFRQFTSYAYGWHTGQEKFVWSSADQHALYRIDTDPLEQQNVYSPFGPFAAKAKKLEERLFDQLGRLPAYEPPRRAATRESAAPDERAIQRLRGLGYVQ